MMPPLKARIPTVTLVLQETAKNLLSRPDRRIRTCNFDVSESRRKLAALKRIPFRDCLYIVDFIRYLPQALWY